MTDGIIFLLRVLEKRVDVRWSRGGQNPGRVRRFQWAMGQRGGVLGVLASSFPILALQASIVILYCGDAQAWPFHDRDRQIR